MSHDHDLVLLKLVQYVCLFMFANRLCASIDQNVYVTTHAKMFVSLDSLDT